MEELIKRLEREVEQLERDIHYVSNDVSIFVLKNARHARLEKIKELKSK